MWTNIDVTPKQLVYVRKKEEKKEGKESKDSKDQQQTDSSALSQDKKTPSSVQPPPETTTEIKTLTQSVPSSNSEEEERKRHEREKKFEQERREREKKMQDENNEKIIDIELSETDTLIMFSLPSYIITPDNPAHPIVSNSNKKYESLLQTKKGSDRYTPNYSQTFNLVSKSKEYHYSGFKTEDMKIGSTVADIHDTLRSKRLKPHEITAEEFRNMVKDILNGKMKNQKKFLLDPDSLMNSHLSFDTQSLEKSMKDSKSITSSKQNITKSTLKESGKSIPSGSENVTTNKESKDTGAVDGTIMLLEDDFDSPDHTIPDTLLKPLKTIERLVIQSRYHEQQVLYKNYPVLSSEKHSKEEKKMEDPTMKLLGQGRKEAKQVKAEDLAEEMLKLTNDIGLRPLFEYECGDLTSGRYISSMDWNSRNPDLLAASYGEFTPEIYESKPGLLMFWTLKNPKFPERIIRTNSRITTCNFSKRNPNLIAIGDYEGSISIFDLRRGSDKPVAESKESNKSSEGKHIDTVTEVKWIDRGAKGEFLVSIGADGKVIEWSMKKGLDFTTLINLKKQGNPAKKKEGKVGVMFLYTTGYSFDFPYDDPSLYFACTDDAVIHKCSVSYNEQYLQNYFGHQGAIYRVRCNPFNSNYFLTCSYDWTIRLWNAKDEDGSKMIFNPPDLTDQVNDIEWAPNTSTLFGAANNDGRFDIWDFKREPLKPIIQYFTMKDKKPIMIPRTCVRFSKTSPVVATGNADGIVEVFRISGLEHEQVSDDDQRKRLDSAVSAADRLSQQKKN